MKNEKIIVFILAFCFLLYGCASTELPGDGGTAAGVRNDLSELQTTQAETTGTSERIDGGLRLVDEYAQQAEERSQNIEDGIRDTQRPIDEGAQLDLLLEYIIEEIRNRGRGQSSADIRTYTAPGRIRNPDRKAEETEHNTFINNYVCFYTDSRLYFYFT